MNRVYIYTQFNSRPDASLYHTTDAATSLFRYSILSTYSILHYVADAAAVTTNTKTLNIPPVNLGEKQTATLTIHNPKRPTQKLFIQLLYKNVFSSDNSFFLLCYEYKNTLLTPNTIGLYEG